jgi:hypothetical protein
MQLESLINFKTNNMKSIVQFMIGILLGIVVLGSLQKYESKNVKPISYPEEIQIAKAGDTLIVSSVSDSIYIGFKHK